MSVATAVISIIRSVIDALVDNEHVDDAVVRALEVVAMSLEEGDAVLKDLETVAAEVKGLAEAGEDPTSADFQRRSDSIRQSADRIDAALRARGLR